MLPPRLFSFFVLVTFTVCMDASAQTSDPGGAVPLRQGLPICDSKGFLEFAQKIEDTRMKRLLSEADFAKAVKEQNTIVLDARSDGSFESLRIKGSKNLAYTAFSERTLQELIPDRSTRILIYCRNNLVNTAPNLEAKQKRDRHPYPDELGRQNVIKAPKVALNIPTYITLMVYGYENVWQLDAVVDPNNSFLEFESKWPEENEREIQELFGLAIQNSSENNVRK